MIRRSTVIALLVCLVASVAQAGRRHRGLHQRVNQLEENVADLDGRVTTLEQGANGNGKSVIAVDSEGVKIGAVLSMSGTDVSFCAV